MLRRLQVSGYKSLRDVTLTMRPLRILIGPNAAGKSNVVDSLRLLSEAVHSDIETAVARRGGTKTVAFLGSPAKEFSLSIDYWVPDFLSAVADRGMRYSLRVAEQGGIPGVASEELRGLEGDEKAGVWFHAAWGKGEALRHPALMSRDPFNTGDPSVLAVKALGFVETYPRILALRTFIESWQFLAVDLARVREPRRDERASTLLPDASNLANVLRTIQGTDAYLGILDDLRSLLEDVTDVSTDLDRGRVLLLLRERPFADPVEALALSDGTLRLLAIFTALGTMPEHSLLCIEEPEHGLHPSLFGPLVDAIRERCPEDGTRQVLLTTHSPDLVDAAEPGDVVTVERDEQGATVLTEIDGPDLRKWLEDFRLGELWRMRQIGGVPR